MRDRLDEGIIRLMLVGSKWALQAATSYPLARWGSLKGATVGYWRAYCCAPGHSRGNRPAGARV
jgi:hypothetical protein